MCRETSCPENVPRLCPTVVEIGPSNPTTLKRIQWVQRWMEVATLTNIIWIHILTHRSKYYRSYFCFQSLRDQSITRTCGLHSLFPHTCVIGVTWSRVLIGDLVPASSRSFCHSRRSYLKRLLISPMNLSATRLEPARCFQLYTRVIISGLPFWACHVCLVRAEIMNHFLSQLFNRLIQNRLNRFQIEPLIDVL